MTNYQKLIEDYKRDLMKSLYYLKYSYQKIQGLPSKLENADPETLETWESFVSRFSRVTDIFVMKYLKVRILNEDPAFQGTVRDFLNKAEKMYLIEDAHQWFDIRDLRNKISHDYTESELENHLETIKKYIPVVFAIEKVI